MTTRVCRGERDGLLRGMGVVLSLELLPVLAFVFAFAPAALWAFPAGPEVLVVRCHGVAFGAEFAPCSTSNNAAYFSSGFFVGL